MSQVRLVRWLSTAIAILVTVAFTSAAFAQTEPRPKQKGRRYKVRIDSSPQQAAIYIDDEKYGIVGYTPWEGRWWKGDIKVIIKKDGYETATRVVRIKRSSRVQEHFLPLVKKVVPGTVDVIAAADKNSFGADVWIDGQLQGQVPVIIEVKDGRHLVEVKKKDFEDYTQWVDIKQGQRVTVPPVLRPLKKEPDKGSILIDADVQDAEVYVDGQKWKDTTPTLVDGVTAGPHVVEVRKEPSMPWKQTVTVIAGKTVKVSAALRASAGGPGGSVRVLADAKGAEVFVDGTKVGPPPVDIKDIKPGEHIIEVRAPGYMEKKKRVSVSAGSAEVLEFELQPEAAAGDVGTIIVVSPVPEAKVSIDGARIGVVPQTKQVAAGEHFVVVEQAGYRTFEEKVRVEPGQEVTIKAELKAVGGIRVLSTPMNATVMIDGNAVGKTPLSLDDVEVGEHVVTILRDDYYKEDKNVTIEGGKSIVVNVPLRRIDTGPTIAEIEREQRARTSFSARTLGREKPIMDFSMGYPHLAEIRFNIGVGTLKGLGLDAGIGVKTFFTRTDISLSARLQLLNKSPFSFGVFGQGGYGTRFNRSQRDSFFLNAGGAVSLTAQGRITITGRFFLEMWSDRHCPGLENGTFMNRTDPSELCRSYLDNSIDPVVKARVDDLLGDDGTGDVTEAKIFKRENGLRPIVSVIVEFALDRKWNVWGILEGTPLQDERPAYTDTFNGILLENDNGVYVRGGMTYKF